MFTMVDQYISVFERTAPFLLTVIASTALELFWYSTSASLTPSRAQLEMRVPLIAVERAKGLPTACGGYGTVIAP